MSKDKNDMNVSWMHFFDNYLGYDPATEHDLFRQVAQTVNRQPIPREVFNQMNDRIVAQIKLSSVDHLLEFCCGNGLFSYELAAHVECVTGIDFAPRLIRTARQFKSRQNIAYILGDATAPLSTLIDDKQFPNKFLLNCSLAYFEPAQLDTILGNILDRLGERFFLFLATGIPSFDLKWNFYNTPERRIKHLKDEKEPGNTNDGLGRWWRTSEIEQICRQRGLTVLIENQPPELSNYRMDAIISPFSSEPWNIDKEEKQVVGHVVFPCGTEKPKAPAIFLRALEESDLERTYRWHNDARLYDSLGERFRRVSRATEAAWLRQKTTYSNTEINLAICLNATGEHIGNVYLRDIDWIARRGELHIFVGCSEHRGKGYGMAAVRQLLHRAFFDLNLNTVYLEVIADNMVAIKVYEKCGFELKKCLKKHVFKLGRYKDVLVMDISSDKYKQLQEKSE
jgi:RimJ/RimL family protein N-acetyltransferase